VRFAKEHSQGKVNSDELAAAEKRSLRPFENPGPAPYEIQYALQETMQDLVGIVRRKMKCCGRSIPFRNLNAGRARRSARTPRIQHWLAYRHRLAEHDYCVGDDCAGGPRAKESRGAQFREDYPTKNDEYGNFNIVVWKGASGEVKLRREPIPPMPDETEADHSGDE